MTCSNHPELEATGFCRNCGKPMCQECQRPALGSIYCAEHVPLAEPLYTAPPPQPEASSFASGAIPGGYSPYTASAPSNGAPIVPPDTGAHPVLALILGFIPGVGAIYNGEYAKGLVHAVIFGLLISLVNSSHHGPLQPLFALLIAIWVFYMAFEAYHTARKRRYGIATEEFSSLLDIRGTTGRFPTGAVILIGLGFILLLDTTEVISMDQLERYWPVALIGFGLYLLYSRLHPDDLNSGDLNGKGPKSNAEVRR